MRRKARQPTVPDERRQTLRRTILDLLEGRSFSAREISAEAGIPEREVYEHLEHIQRSVDRKAATLVVTPAECKKCGFVFSKRERLKKPGRCPACRGEAIKEPLFSIRRKAST